MLWKSLPCLILSGFSLGHCIIIFFNIFLNKKKNQFGGLKSLTDTDVSWMFQFLLPGVLSYTIVCFVLNVDKLQQVKMSTMWTLVLDW